MPLPPSPRSDEPTGVIAHLSLYLYAVAILLIAIGLIVLAVLQSNHALSTIPLAVGTSILASLIVQSVYGRIAEEHIVKKVAADTASAAVDYARSVLHDHFTQVVPKKLYPRTTQPLQDFRRDIAEQLRGSKFYRHKGDGASFAGFRLTKLAMHPALVSKERITLCILDPRADQLVKQQAHLKLRNRGSAYSKEDITRKAAEIRNEIFITLVALLDISHLLRVEVSLHRESLFFRSELFENGIFLSYYLGGNYPGTYFFTRDTHIFEAFMLNFQQAIDCSEYVIQFEDSLSEEELSKHLKTLGCTEEIATLRHKRDKFYQEYEANLTFEPDDLF